MTAFKAFKVRTPTPEISEQVQLAAFAKGYRWATGDGVRYTMQPYLCFSTRGIITYLRADEARYFNNSPKPEIQVGG